MRRERTDTPLQALVTMNDPQFVEAARVLARAALLSIAPATSTARWITWQARLLARDLQRARARHCHAGLSAITWPITTAAPADATEAGALGNRSPRQLCPAPELAALTMVANEMMNLDEVLLSERK